MKGHWKIEWRRGFRVIAEHGQGDRDLIARISGTEDDARLIAAAPEMLHALKQLRDAMVRYMSDSETKLYEVTQATAAINKAERK